MQQKNLFSMMLFFFKDSLKKLKKTWQITTVT